MKFRLLEAVYQGYMYRIEEDYPEIGVYLYVYKGERCIKDFLQNDIETCKNIALEEYGVVESLWKEI